MPGLVGIAGINKIKHSPVTLNLNRLETHSYARALGLVRFAPGFLAGESRRTTSGEPTPDTSTLKRTCGASARLVMTA